MRRGGFFEKREVGRSPEAPEGSRAAVRSTADETAKQNHGASHVRVYSFVSLMQ